MPLSKKIQVLIIDDEIDFAEPLATRLKMRHFNAVIAPSGEQALEMVQHRPPDVILLDLRMPGISGLETLRRLRSQYPVLPVIAISGHQTQKDEKEARKLGIFECFEKPIDMEELVDTLKQAYHNRLEDNMMAITFAEAGDFHGARELMGYESYPEEILSPSYSKPSILYIKESKSSENEELIQFVKNKYRTVTIDEEKVFNFTPSNINIDVVIIDTENILNWDKAKINNLKIKFNHPEIIVVSSQFDFNKTTKLIKNNVLDYITKPIDYDYLVLRIHDASTKSYLESRKKYLDKHADM